MVVSQSVQLAAGYCPRQITAAGRALTIARPLTYSNYELLPAHAIFVLLLNLQSHMFSSQQVSVDANRHFSSQSKVGPAKLATGKKPF